MTVSLTGKTRYRVQRVGHLWWTRYLVVLQVQENFMSLDEPGGLAWRDAEVFDLAGVETLGGPQA